MDTGAPSLSHQRRPEEEKEKIDKWYDRGAVQGPAAKKYRKTSITLERHCLSSTSKAGLVTSRTILKSLVTACRLLFVQRAQLMPLTSLFPLTVLPSFHASRTNYPRDSGKVAHRRQASATRVLSVSLKSPQSVLSRNATRCVDVNE